MNPTDRATHLAVWLLFGAITMLFAASLAVWGAGGRTYTESYVFTAVESKQETVGRKLRDVPFAFDDKGTPLAFSLVFSFSRIVTSTNDPRSITTTPAAVSVEVDFVRDAHKQYVLPLINPVTGQPEPVSFTLGEVAAMLKVVADANFNEVTPTALPQTRADIQRRATREHPTGP